MHLCVVIVVCCLTGCSVCRPSRADRAWAAPASGGSTRRPTPWPTWFFPHRQGPANASSAPSWHCWFSSAPASTVWPVKVGGGSTCMYQSTFGQNACVLYLLSTSSLTLSLCKQSVLIEWRNASNAKSQSPRKLDKVRRNLVLLELFGMCE